MSAPTAPLDDSLQAGNYEYYTQENNYSSEQGLLVMGCADGSPVVVRTVKPYGTRVQTWSARKRRTPPVFPAPAPDTADSTLLNKTYSIPLPTPIAGPTPAWTFEMSGQNVYLERVPTDETTGFPAGKLPFTFPILGQAAQAGMLGAGLGALAGGLGFLGPLILKPDFATGNYSWPFTSISVGYADPTLSQTFTVDSGGLLNYNLDQLNRG